MWDERYSGEALAYGSAPNDFLAQEGDRLNPGNCLCLAEGQGRNAVWIAGRGLDVTAVDQSAVGMERARALAAAGGLSITTDVADLTDYDLGEARWDNVVSIFGHLPPALRKDVHKRVVRALKPGGIFLIEAYTADQLAMPGKGGPHDPEMMPDLEKLQAELAGLEFVIGQEIHREVNEGLHHHGESAVVQILARKPLGD